ncbi:MAG TPA: SDR family oxidoreductase [Candidatus Krumholzibacteria bacterium]|nr:SDR family oxidoreductase [Candidatus Krumholzibacteria bacterium]
MKDLRANQKVMLVTGASSGIGEATATRLAGLGHHVVMVSRTEERGNRSRQRIHAAYADASTDLLIADLTTTTALRKLAGEFNAKYDRLDVLINNAAVMTSTRRVTPEGFEMQLFVNHLAYFLLTGLLLDSLRRSQPSRIVSVSSTAHTRGVIDFNDFQMEHHYRGYEAYANTKLMNIMFTYELARRLEGSGVTANCLHPGVIRTGLMRGVSPVLHAVWQWTGKFFKQPSEGAETPVYLATSPEVEGVTGKYFRHAREMGTTRESNDRDLQRRLWEESERLTGFNYPV